MKIYNSHNKTLKWLCYFLFVTAVFISCKEKETVSTVKPNVVDSFSLVKGDYECSCNYKYHRSYPKDTVGGEKIQIDTNFIYNTKLYVSFTIDRNNRLNNPYVTLILKSDTPNPTSFSIPRYYVDTVTVSHWSYTGHSRSGPNAFAFFYKDSLNYIHSDFTEYNPWGYGESSTNNYLCKKKK